ncbi:MAG TPA: peptidylprolyl isomerase [Anaerolineales bacterium]|jgi:cyclophilin family peptidyl-prolyl cis-trans isomerase
MSKNQRPAKKKPQNKLSTIQQMAIAVAIVGVIVIAWALLPLVQNLTPKATPSQAAQAGAPNQPPQAAPASNAKQYASAPPMTIDVKKQYFATFKMARGGEFVVQLYPDKAPITVNSFVFLAKDGFFNGVTFHRVLEGFMAQGGDPTGTGMGGPGYEFVNEDSDLKFDKPGVVAMANAGRDTNGSQFFITFGPTEQLNGGYTIFGQVTSGMDVVNGITRRDPDQNPNFTGDVIESITISEK